MIDKKQTQEVEMVQTAVDLGIYTPLSVAKEEIWRRWNDQELRKNWVLNQRYAREVDQEKVPNPIFLATNFPLKVELSK